MKQQILKIGLPKLLLVTVVFIIGSGCSGPGDGQSTFWPDFDGDGYGDNSVGNGWIHDDNDFPDDYVTNREDCDDTNANININAIEIPDNLIDENCNDKLAFTFYFDNDSDGFGNSSITQVFEVDNINNDAPEKYSWIAGDCDDNNAIINPKADEVIGNNIDDNCDGNLDFFEIYEDFDGDGYGSNVILAPPAQGVHNNFDCDDNNANINPYANEIPNNGLDENCDGND